MGKITKTIKNKKESIGYTYPEYTNKELRELETELNAKYLIKKVLSDGKEHHWYDEEQWQKDNGGLGGLGGVIVAGLLPVQYEVNRDKLGKLYKLQGKTEFAKRQEIADLVAKSMKVVNDTPAVVDDDPLAF